VGLNQEKKLRIHKKSSAMQNKFFQFFILFFTLFIKVTNAQLIEHYFTDTETKYGSKIYSYINDDPYIIICGKSFDNYPGQPSVSKLDTLGNLIWTTTTHDTFNYQNQNAYAYKIFKSGQFVYALIIIHVWPNEHKELWKIDDSNGIILWKNMLYTDYFYLPIHLINYNDTSFLIGYYEADYKTKYAFIFSLNG
jgi:hypothetical protein